MTNYISYSLYGSDPYYVNGALNNLVNNSKIMPGWVSVLYVSKFTYENFHLLLSRFRDNLIIVAGHDNNISSIWRFFATDLSAYSNSFLMNVDEIISKTEWPIALYDQDGISHNVNPVYEKIIQALN